MTNIRRAIFFDRDGVLNEPVFHGDQYTAPWTFEEFKLYPNAKLAIDLARKLGYYTIVISNQPDVQLGNMTKEDMEKISNHLIETLDVDSYSYCEHRGSANYKPNNGMVEHYIEDLKIDRNSSYIIGDRWKDIVCGASSRLRTIYIGTTYDTPPEHDHINPDLMAIDVLHAVQQIEWHDFRKRRKAS